MADLPGSNELVIRSHKGPYSVFFASGVPDCLASALPSDGARAAHVLIDEKVSGLYAKDMSAFLPRAASVLSIAATESNKSLEAMPRYAGHLLSRGVRRGDRLVAIGGGIIQDISCFLAATLLRGLDWSFIPTTLLSQADSCVGSKSSINAGGAKNAMGTFTPPREIFVCAGFLKTLDEKDVRSGVGEMLKIHAIEGPESFDRFAAGVRALARSETAMSAAVRGCLEIKKGFVEADEFDKGPRLVLNYGHTFGHAIEAATEFAVPHGIAVSLGMDMANFIAAKTGVSSPRPYARMHAALAANYAGFETLPVPADPFFSALSKDKKNTRTQIVLILPDSESRIARVPIEPHESFRAACLEFLARGRKEALFPAV